MPQIQRRNPKQERATVTVDAIFAATAQILIESGHDRASVAQIAKRAGVSVGSVYQYFTTKDALIRALADRTSDKMIASFESELSTWMSEPLTHAIKLAIKKALSLYETEAPLLRALMSMHGATRPDGVRALKKRLTDLFRLYLEARRSELRIQDLELPVFILVNAIDSVAVAAVMERPEYLSEEKVAHELTQMATRYLLP